MNKLLDSDDDGLLIKIIVLMMQLKTTVIKTLFITLTF